MGKGSHGRLRMIYVLIPAYDEAKALPDVLRAIPRAIRGRPVHVILISDGSTDGTPEVAASLGAEVIDLQPNRGKGAALRAGTVVIADRSFDCVVLMDGDGQHDPWHLEPLVAPVLDGTHDVSIGSRYLWNPHRGSAPRNRYLVRRVAVWLLRRRLLQPVTDPFSGYRCLSRRAFDTIRLEGDEYQGELELRFEAALHGLAVQEVAVPRIYVAHFSKMATHGGPFWGRLRVIGQYASTICRKSKQLASAPGSLPVRSD